MIAFPGIWLCRPFGAWVAKTNPRPYLRACDDNASVLRVHAVNPFAGAIVWASSIISSPRSGRAPGGLRLIHANSAICSWLTKLWRCSSDESPIMLMTDTLAR